MKNNKTLLHLKKLIKVKKERHHPLIHHIHKKYGISRKTLFYIKEYGPHSNVPKVIIKESIKILLFASIVSSLGGFALEEIKNIFVTFVPLIILLPTLNNLIGSYGTVISSRYSTMLHEGIVKKKLFNKPVLKLFSQLLLIAIITSLMSSALAIIISDLAGHVTAINAIIKIVIINFVDVILLVNILFFVAVFAGHYYYKKGEDPSNFLIPITTSVADFGNMVILAALIVLIL